MIEFERTIITSEVNSGYLNLSDDRGRPFGPDFDLDHRTKVAIKDSHGRVTFSQKHHANQLWGMLKNWIADNVSFEKDAHSAALHSHLSSWAFAARRK
jgi:hypothetical protein